MFLPAGTHIFLKLVDYLRYHLKSYGFQEVLTPTMYKQSLWKQSGHWLNYKDDMFTVGEGSKSQHGSSPPVKSTGRADCSPSVNDDMQDEEHGLKPMNCPGHCLLYASKRHSYKELPIRYSEFGTLHRNENSGSLSGLTRVRRFHQDDGHIFCRLDQVLAEVRSQLKLMQKTYRMFGLNIKGIYLSTPPTESIEGYLGSRDEWKPAIDMLSSALKAEELPFSVNPGEAAFYGPKIDVAVEDCNGKEHQTATIQLDFQLPKRFELTYEGAPKESTLPAASQKSEPVRTADEAVDLARQISDDADGDSAHGGRPVMIHRALFGSLERFMALLAEHYKRRWPFWLSPKQVLILTVTSDPKVVAYAKQVAKTLRNTEGSSRDQTFNVDLDVTGETISKKIARARKIEGIRYNVVAVVGPRNVESATIDLNISGQRDLENSFKVVERIEQESHTPLQESESSQRGDKEMEAVRMEPQKFLSVMKEWEAHYL